MIRMHSTPVRPLLVGLLSIALGCLALVRPLAAQTHLPAFWQTDGEILTMQAANGRLYLGGWFGYLGPQTGGLVGTSRTTGELLGDFPAIDGTVYNAISDEQGGWYVCGDLRTIGGHPVFGLAHVLADHTLEHWFPRCQGAQALSLHQGTLYVGGTMETVEGMPRSHLAAFDVASQALLDWSPSVAGGWSTSGEVLSIAGTDSAVYVGGWFEYCQGQPRIGIAAVHPVTGALLGWNPGGEGTVVLAIVPNGEVVWLGGSFETIGGQPRRGVAEVNVATGLPTNWLPGNSGYVPGLAISNGVLYMGGQFSSIMGVERTSLAAFDLATRVPTAWNPTVDGMVQCLAVRDGAVYAGGTFLNVDGVPRGRAAAFECASGALLPWSTHVGSAPTAIIGGTDAVLVGGAFRSAGGVLRSRLAAIDLATGRVNDWAPAVNDVVRMLAVEGPTLYAYGQFSNVGGVARDRMVALDAFTGEVRPWAPPTPNGDVYDMEPIDGTLYLAGAFRSLGGVTRSGLAALDATSGALLPWSPAISANWRVLALERRGSTLYVGGDFTSLAGQPRLGAAAFDARSGALTTWNPKVAGVVNAIHARGGSVYLGGGFSTVANTARRNFAAVDTSGGALLQVPIGFSAPVGAITTTRTSLYVSGSFSASNGDPNGVAAYDLATFGRRPWSPNTYPSLGIELDSSGDTLFVNAGMEMEGRWWSPVVAFSEQSETNPPRVTVVAPNGGERLAVGSLVELRGLVTDESPISESRAYLSRSGPNGPWESVGYLTTLANWTVTAPTTNSAYLRIVARDLVGNVGEDISDGPFSIVASDSVAPAVKVLSPNGQEELTTGTTVDLRWTATDAGGVAQVKLLLSRTGVAGPWETIADPVPNTGSYPWVVTGPGAVLAGYLRVEARDATGNVGSDLSDAPFSIVQAPVPTRVELFRVQPTVSGVRVTWRLADPAGVARVEVQRSLEAEWTVCASSEEGLEGSHEILDVEVPGDARVSYRLSIRELSGQTYATPPIAVRSQAPVRSVALLAPAPNPTRGLVWLGWELPAAERVNLELVDVSGRVVAVMADGPLEAGRYGARVDTSGLPPGLYFARLRVAGTVCSRRITIVR